MGRTRHPIIATSLSTRLKTAINAVPPDGLNAAVLITFCRRGRTWASLNTLGLGVVSEAM
jgi:hypothetical protein